MDENTMAQQPTDWNAPENQDSAERDETIKALRKAVLQLEQQRNEAREKIEHLKAEIERLKTQYHDVSALFRREEADCKHWREQHRAVCDQRDELMAEVERLKNELAIEQDAQVGNEWETGVGIIGNYIEEQPGKLQAYTTNMLNDGWEWPPFSHGDYIVWRRAVNKAVNHG